ncbi:MAG: dephospho-CoA kinase [Coriobacteriales bacterium]|nr:dephospho-CoA kinase [Coriobacteriales bacterium]
MYVVVLTGGIGAGKSEATAFFREKGAVVLELDRIATHLLEPESVLLARVVAEFGPDVLNADGSVNRERLASAAFCSPENAEKLNAIIHPAVASEVGPAITDLRLLPNPPEVVVIDVPLLVEAPVFAELADEVVAIEAPVETRVSRAMARGMSEADVRARIACQATDAERRELADVVIENAGTLEEFRDALERYWSEAVRSGP